MRLAVFFCFAASVLAINEFEHYAGNPASFTPCAGDGQSTSTSSPTLYDPRGMAYNYATGMIYVSEYSGHRIRSFSNDQTGVVATVAGDAGADTSGDGVFLNKPSGMVYVPFVSYPIVYICDTYNFKIKSLLLTTFVISLVAGTGVLGDTINLPRLNSQFAYPTAIFFHRNVLYTSDTDNSAIKKVHITTDVVGFFTALSYAGSFVIFRYRGYGLMVTDHLEGTWYHAIHQTHMLTGVNTVFAGANLLSGNSVTGTDPTVWRFYRPCGLVVDCTRRDLFISECGPSAIKKYNFLSGQLENYAGVYGVTTPLNTVANKLSAVFNTPRTMFVGRVDTDYLWVADIGRVSILRLPTDSIRVCATETMSHSTMTRDLSPDDPTLTLTFTFTATTKRMSHTWTAMLSDEITVSDTLSKEESLTLSLTRDPTDSATFTDSLTNTDSRTWTFQISEDPTDTASQTLTDSLTGTDTDDRTQSATFTDSLTNTDSRTWTFQISEDPTDTASQTLTDSLTDTDTDDRTQSATFTDSLTDTDTFSSDVSLTDTVSGSDTRAFSDTMTRTILNTRSRSVTRTAEETEERTKTVSLTDSPSLSFTDSVTSDGSQSGPTVSVTMTDHITRTRSESVDATDDRSLTNSVRTASRTESVSFEATLESTRTYSQTMKIPSPTPSLTFSVSPTMSYESSDTRSSTGPTRSIKKRAVLTQKPTAAPTAAPTFKPHRITLSKSKYAWITGPPPSPKAPQTQAPKASLNGTNSTNTTSPGITSPTSNGTVAGTSFTNGSNVTDDPSTPLPLTTLPPTTQPPYTEKPKKTKRPTVAPTPFPNATVGPDGETEAPRPAPGATLIFQTDHPTLPPGTLTGPEPTIKSHSEKKNDEEEKKSPFSRGVGALANASEEDVEISVIVIAVALLVLCVGLLIFAGYKKRHPGINRVSIDFKPAPTRRFDTIRFGTLLWMIFPRARVGEDEMEDDTCPEVDMGSQLGSSQRRGESRGGTASLLSYDDVHVGNVFAEDAVELNLENRPSTTNMVSRIELDDLVIHPDDEFGSPIHGDIGDRVGPLMMSPMCSKPQLLPLSATADYTDVFGDDGEAERPTTGDTFASASGRQGDAFEPTERRGSDAFESCAPASFADTPKPTSEFSRPSSAADASVFDAAAARPTSGAAVRPGSVSGSRPGTGKSTGANGDGFDFGGFDVGELGDFGGDDTAKGVGTGKSTWENGDGFDFGGDAKFGTFDMGDLVDFGGDDTTGTGIVASRPGSAAKVDDAFSFESGPAIGERPKTGDKFLLGGGDEEMDMIEAMMLMEGSRPESGPAGEHSFDPLVGRSAGHWGETLGQQLKVDARLPYSAGGLRPEKTTRKVERPGHVKSMFDEPEADTVEAPLVDDFFGAPAPERDATPAGDFLDSPKADAPAAETEAWATKKARPTSGRPAAPAMGVGNVARPGSMAAARPTSGAAVRPGARPGTGKSTGADGDGFDFGGFDPDLGDFGGDDTAKDGFESGGNGGDDFNFGDGAADDDAPDFAFGEEKAAESNVPDFAFGEEKATATANNAPAFDFGDVAADQEVPDFDFGGDNATANNVPAFDFGDVAADEEIPDFDFGGNNAAANNVPAFDFGDVAADEEVPDFDFGGDNAGGAEDNVSATGGGFE